MWLFLVHDFATRRITLQQHQIWCHLFHSTASSSPVLHNHTVDLATSSVSSASLDHHTDRVALTAAIGTEGCLDRVALDTLVESLMWPSKECHGCRNTLLSTTATQPNLALSLDEENSNQLWNTSAVLSYLQASYWDHRWAYDNSHTATITSKESSMAYPASQTLDGIAPTDAFHTNPIWYYILMGVMVFGAVIAVRDSISLLCGPLSTEFPRKRSHSTADSSKEHTAVH